MFWNTTYVLHFTFSHAKEFQQFDYFFTQNHWYVFNIAGEVLSHGFFTSLSKEHRGHRSFWKRRDPVTSQIFIYSHLIHVISLS